MVLAKGFSQCVLYWYHQSVCLDCLHLTQRLLLLQQLWWWHMQLEDTEGKWESTGCIQLMGSYFLSISDADINVHWWISSSIYFIPLFGVSYFTGLPISVGETLSTSNHAVSGKKGSIAVAAAVKLLHSNLLFLLACFILYTDNKGIKHPHISAHLVFGNCEVNIAQL